MKRICYIVGAGEFSGQSVPLDEAYVIAADAGYDVLNARDIVPDLVVGDFDSLKNTPDHPNVLKVPTEKNDTDMSLAIREGLAAGFKNFIIDGGIGGRHDHTIANIQLLKYLSMSNANGILLGRDICMTAITDQSIGFSSRESGLVSVFAFGGCARGVTLKGLKYELDEVILTDENPLGVSNEFIGKPVSISVCSGTLLVTWEGDAFELIVD